MSKTDPTDRLSETAFKIIKDALETGKIKLGDIEYTLQASEVVDLAVKMAANKIKKMTDVDPPEDYSLKETMVDEE